MCIHNKKGCLQQREEQLEIYEKVMDILKKGGNRTRNLLPDLKVKKCPVCNCTYKLESIIKNKHILKQVVNIE